MRLIGLFWLLLPLRHKFNVALLNCFNALNLFLWDDGIVVLNYRAALSPGADYLYVIYLARFDTIVVKCLLVLHSIVADHLFYCWRIQ